jgi:uncharacterized membrane protein
MRKTGFIVVFTVALVAGAIALYSSSPGCTAVGGTQSLSMEVARLKPGTAATYCYKDDAGRRLRFVLARGSDGKVRSVFDACRQCFPWHRGYQIVGNQLICRVCGNRYPIDHMTQGKASCVPASLPHEQTGHWVRVKVSDLESGRALF